MREQLNLSARESIRVATFYPFIETAIFPSAEISRLTNRPGEILARSKEPAELLT